MLPKEAIEEFKKLYLRKYGIRLTDAEASFRANNLFSLYEAVYGEPDTSLIQTEKKRIKNSGNKQPG